MSEFSEIGRASDIIDCISSGSKRNRAKGEES